MQDSLKPDHSPEQDEVVLAYVTVETQEKALSLAKVLIEEHLAGCVNLFPNMTAIYSWKGRLETASETVLIVKSLARLRPALESRIRSLHTYETPCILFLPVRGGHEPYLNWLISGCRS